MRSGSILAACAALLLLGACSANGGSSLGAAHAADSGAGSSEAGGFDGGLLDVGVPTDASICSISSNSTIDEDHDGYSPLLGDCNECSPTMNPGAYDFPANGIDEDCNGTIDDEPQGCDTGFAPDSTDALLAAKALGICRTTKADATGKERSWGIISARWVYPDGAEVSTTPKSSGSACEGQGGEGNPPNPLSHGVLSQFGSNTPREGKSLLALSSGIARTGSNGKSPLLNRMCTSSGTPSGFPVSSTAACSGKSVADRHVVYDGIALELKIRTPSNARSLSFDFNFFASEFPMNVCGDYNDFFVALLMDSQAPGIPSNQNISFDKAKNPVSVNNSLLEVCLPQTVDYTVGQQQKKKDYPCSLGTSGLAGTGYEGHAATGWLQTSAPVAGGEEITLRYAIWDAMDEIMDCTVLLDKFRWEVEPGTETVTIRPPK